MKQLSKLAIIGITAGVILAAFLHIVYGLTGNQAYVLLYNMDYIPVLKEWAAFPIVGVAFHFIICVVSVIILFYFLSWINFDPKSMFPYVFAYTVGGGILFSLTALTDKPPDLFNLNAWVVWTSGHALYGIAVSLLIKWWIH